MAAVMAGETSQIIEDLESHFKVFCLIVKIMKSHIGYGVRL